MASVNKVTLLGHVGQDPSIRYLESGVAMCSLRMATSETMTDSKTGERKSRTEWHNVTLWRQSAEFADKYVKTGALVYIEGQLRTRTWQDKQGIQHKSTEIISDHLQLLDRKSDEAAKPSTGPVPGEADDIKDLPF
ncbi:MAG: single-stranded DNA-binding protein [Flavobacteriales bacterium]|jgi:single-strand DNA-binding protein|nr:single-stranded DNA-binding protein [Flavobacteriales bacterium]